MSEAWEGEKHSFFSWWSGEPETPEQKALREAKEREKQAVNALAAEHAAPLPPFVADPTCPKCGSSKVRWGYGRYLEPPKCDAAVFERVGLAPYISLWCKRCGFGDITIAQIRADWVWVMAPKDTP